MQGECRREMGREKQYVKGGKLGGGWKLGSLFGVAIHYLNLLTI